MADDLEIEMVAKIRNRVDPAIVDTWNTFKLFLSSYTTSLKLRKFKDFSDAFGALKTNDIIRLGSYGKLLYILRKCDAPSAETVKDYGQKIFDSLSHDEKLKLEEWNNRKQTKQNVSEKSIQDLEKEMIDEIGGRVGPAKQRQWKSFELFLKKHLSDAELASCSDVLSVFELLQDNGTVSIGNYSAFADILAKVDVRSKVTVLTYTELIKLKLDEAEKEIHKEVNDENAAEPEASDQLKRKAPDADGIAVAQTSKFGKANDDTRRSLLTDMRAKCNKSVGCIVTPKGTGTGFRVGSKYILTCWHVVKDVVTETSGVVAGIPTININNLTRPDVFIQFEYKRRGIADPNMKFHFVSNIPYYNPSLDVVILELTEVDGKPFPPPIVKFGLPRRDDDIFFIGHPKGEPMREDPEIKVIEKNYETVKEIKEMNEWCKQKWGTDNYLPLLDETKIIFDCAFQHGASGSPGMIVADEFLDPVVVIMLQGGVPKSYLDMAPAQQLVHQIPNSYLKEYGLGMHTLFNDVNANPALENLRLDIFRQ